MSKKIFREWDQRFRPRNTAQNRHQDTTFQPEAERRIVLARAALFWEQLWPALWPSLGLASFFATLALSGFLEGMPPWLHWLVLGTGIFALGYTLHRACKNLRYPDRTAGIRRVEKSSNLTHRPLEGLQDEPVETSGNPALWEAHQSWLRAQTTRLRAGLPHPRFVRRDPFAIRTPLILALVVSAFVAGTDAPYRLQNAFLPPLAWTQVSGSLDAWVNPPPYTGVAPLYLSATQEATLVVPRNSRVLIHVQGGSPPTLWQSRADGSEETLAFEPGGGKDSFKAEVPLSGPTELEIRQGNQRSGAWNFETTPDHPPKITFTEPVQTTARQTMKFAYEAHDDYGITAVEVHMSLDPSVENREQTFFMPETPVTNRHITIETPDSALKTNPVFGLPLPAMRPMEARHSAFRDLTTHPWAGLPVQMQLVARDDAGNEGKSAPQTVLLAEKTFKKPLARAIVEQRRRLALNPATRASVAGFLEAFTLDPERYIRSAPLYLALRAAWKRLVLAKRPENLEGILELLWDIALHIEDGNLSVTERELRNAREALAQALVNDAPAEEINQLTRQLAQALARYLEALKNTMQAGQQAPDPSWMPPDTGSVDQADLENMLAMIDELASTGAREKARELLSQLDNILENLNTGVAREQAFDSALSDALSDMGTLIEEQRTLMDETFAQTRKTGSDHQKGTDSGSAAGQDTSKGKSSGGPLQQLRKDQQGIAGNLQGFMEKLSKTDEEVPADLRNALRAMQRAEKNLNEGQAEQATRAQGEALDALRQGAQTMVDELLSRVFGGMSGKGNAGRGNGNTQSDPLGRARKPFGKGDNEDLGIPDRHNMQKARSILEELRQRASEKNRPRPELDYLERLLRRF